MSMLLLGPMTLWAAQSQKKNKNAKDGKEAEDIGMSSLMPLPETQAIEMMISQMLAVWQIGDQEMLHSFYAEDVLVVSGAWEPPLQGWQNYLRAYLAQRARTQGGRLERTNTFTKVLGATAWVTYQWQFIGQVDGAPASAVGQTTLVLEKRAGKWLITLNHTSVSPPPPPKPAPVSTQPVPQTPQSTGPAGGVIPGA